MVYIDLFIAVGHPIKKRRKKVKWIFVLTVLSERFLTRHFNVAVCPTTVLTFLELTISK